MEVSAWRAGIQGVSRAWRDDSGVDAADLLLTGSKLSIARNWLSSHSDDLLPEERAFVEASVRAHNRRRRANRRNRFIAATLVVRA